MTNFCRINTKLFFRIDCNFLSWLEVLVRVRDKIKLMIDRTRHEKVNLQAWVEPVPPYPQSSEEKKRMTSSCSVGVRSFLLSLSLFLFS